MPVIGLVTTIDKPVQHVFNYLSEAANFAEFWPNLSGVDSIDYVFSWERSRCACSGSFWNPQIAQGEAVIGQTDAQNSSFPCMDWVKIATLTFLTVIAILSAVLIVSFHRRKREKNLSSRSSTKQVF